MFFNKMKINPKFLNEYRRNFGSSATDKELMYELGLDKIKEIHSVEKIGNRYYVKYINNDNSNVYQIVLNRNYIFYHPEIKNWSEPVFVEDGNITLDNKYYEDRIKWLFRELIEIVPINKLKRFAWNSNETCTNMDYINKVKSEKDQEHLNILQMAVRSDWDENIEFIINKLLDTLIQKPVRLFKKCQW